jgi:small subunit ribosomal protein S20
MANIKSSEKANRQRIRRTARNTAQKTAMRTAIKKLRAVIASPGSKNAKEAQALLKSAVRAIDMAASKGVIKRGTASRSVSRLTVAVSSLKA